MLPVTCYVLMDKIKIVFILGTLDIGGTERQFLEIVRRLNRNCFEPRVLAFVCHGKLRTEIEALRISFTCLGFSGLKGKFHLGSYIQLYKVIRDIIRYLKQERPHIVQSYLFWTNIYGSIAADNNDYNTIQWGIKWDNWINNSGYVGPGASYQNYPQVWNIYKIEDLWGDEITFKYDQVEELLHHNT